MSGDWFAPRRYGYGAGLPIAWQGWALLGGYLAAATAAATVVPRHPVAGGAAIAALTLGFASVGARRTRGGWRWRSGREA